MQEQTRHRSDAHGHVVGESVISEGFSPAIGRRDVDDQRVAAYGNRAECHAVDGTQKDEYGQQACQDITGKNGCKQQIGHDVDGFAGKSVVQISHEGARTQGRYGVATQDGTDGRLSARESFFQIERQNRNKQPKSEIKQEIGCKYTNEAACD